MLPSLISYHQGALCVFQLPSVDACNCWISTEVNPPRVDLEFSKTDMTFFLSLEIPTYHFHLISHFIKSTGALLEPGTTLTSHKISYTLNIPYHLFLV